MIYRIQQGEAEYPLNQNWSLKNYDETNTNINDPQILRI